MRFCITFYFCVWKIQLVENEKQDYQVNEDDGEISKCPQASANLSCVNLVAKWQPNEQIRDKMPRKTFNDHDKARKGHQTETNSYKFDGISF